MLRLVIRGRVQGVGFRWFVREEARRLGLSGWVMNRPDGAVELAADGTAAGLAALRQVAARGPDAAQVSDVEELPGQDAGDMPYPFSVRR